FWCAKSTSSKPRAVSQSKPAARSRSGRRRPYRQRRADVTPSARDTVDRSGGTRRMAGRYGMSFAAKMIQEGKYAEAIEEATRAVARDEEDPTPLVERASAYAWLERYPE